MTTAATLKRAAAACAMFLSACSSFDDSWPRREGAPDLARMEAAHTEAGGERDVRAISWVPLVALHVESFGDADALLREGATYEEADAYGPLVFAGDLERLHYTDDQELYERQQSSHFAWGLWQRHESDVKTAGGWRVETRSSLLWGLLSWPEMVYYEEAPSSVVRAGG